MASRGTCGADIAVYIEAGPENGRIAHPSGDLPGQSAGSGDATDLAGRANAIAIDGPVVFLFGDDPILDHAYPSVMSRLLLWTVHAAGIQLNDAIRIRSTAITDARIFGVEFHDIDPSNRSVEHIVSRHDLVEGRLDATLAAAVPYSESVARRHHDWFVLARVNRCRGIRRGRQRRCGG
mgnify:CR=1 FL=1